MEFQFNDGGRSAAGWKGDAGDCAVRSIAIASGKSYQEVYDAINVLSESERPRRGRNKSSARNGVFRRTAEKYLFALGAKWTPTMQIGQGCKVHLRAEELPAGKLVVSCSRHWTAVINGVIQDTYNPDRGGMRCVYGYYILP